MFEFLDKLLLETASQAEEVKGFQGDFRWLSNFYPIEPFEYGGVTYKNTENFYQAMKTLNLKERAFISELEPGKAKRFCSEKNLSFVCRPEWDKIKMDVMEYALRIKFSQEKFKKLLLATRDIPIEETNNWGDVFWGRLPSGEGANHLGLMVMRLREELKQGLELKDNLPRRKQNTPVIPQEEPSRKKFLRPS